MGNDLRLLLEWILKNNILNEIFGNRTHHELVKRASESYRLLARQDVLSDEHLDLLWNASNVFVSPDFLLSHPF